MSIEQIAKQHDAAIIVDKDGDVAIQRRLYDKHGVKVVRYAPFPGCYHAPTWWATLSDDQIVNAVC